MRTVSRLGRVAGVGWLKKPDWAADWIRDGSKVWDERCFKYSFDGRDEPVFCSLKRHRNRRISVGDFVTPVWQWT